MFLTALYYKGLGLLHHSHTHQLLNILCCLYRVYQNFHYPPLTLNVRRNKNLFLGHGYMTKGDDFDVWEPFLFPAKIGSFKPRLSGEIGHFSDAPKDTSFVHIIMRLHDQLIIYISYTVKLGWTFVTLGIKITTETFWNGHSILSIFVRMLYFNWFHLFSP